MHPVEPRFLERVPAGRIALLALLACFAPLLSSPAGAQEARRRFERLCQIRQEKLDRILPEAMRENGVDMWITVLKEGLRDPLYYDFGEGYAGSIGYYVFTDRGGDRIERAALGIEDRKLEACGVFDIIQGDFDLQKFVSERDPKRIALNMSDTIGAADGLSHSSYQHLVKTLGPRYVERFVSAEKLASDFRSRRVASEIVAFGEAGEMSREIAERALSNEVVTPAVTTLEDVSWWMQDQLLSRGLESSFGTPSVYVTGPDGIEATSNERIIQRGDFLIIDWGVGYLNFYTDVKRVAYVLKPGEIGVPPGIQHAFDQALKVREVLRRNIRPGPTAAAMLEHLNDELSKAGFELIEFNRPTDKDTTDVVIGCHSVGNTGHGIGPSIAWFNPERLQYTIKPSNLFSIELFAYTRAAEFGGKKVRIPLEDDAIVTERGVEWLYPVNRRVLLIK
jgi:Xaa-Pro aminopeptidase